LENGRIFVLLFRWMLLLLIALVIEKSIEALVVNGNQVHGINFQFFLETTIFFPFHYLESIPYLNYFPFEKLFGDYQKEILFSKGQEKYIVSVLCFLAVLLITFRYFLCLMEPVTAKCTTETMSINPGDSQWEDGLGKLGIHWIFFIIGISIFEFVLILNAALSLSNLEQVMIFMVWLATFDLLFFMLLPLLIKLLFFLLATIAFFALYLFFSSFSYFKMFKDNKDSFDNIIESIQTKIFAIRGEMVNYLNRWSILYAGWDMIDFCVPMLGLYLLNGYSVSSFEVAQYFFIATFLVTSFNIYSNLNTYKSHIGILILTKPLKTH
jgi:hypothetical protein